MRGQVEERDEAVFARNSNKKKKKQNEILLIILLKLETRSTRPGFFASIITVVYVHIRHGCSQHIICVCIDSKLASNRSWSTTRMANPSRNFDDRVSMHVFRKIDHLDNYSFRY